jgi:hypothetical protein
VEYLSEARLAAAVLRLAAGQALLTVCESGLRPTPSARAAAASAFAESVSMFASSDLRQELEQDSDHDKQKEKEIIETGCNHASPR